MLDERAKEAMAKALPTRRLCFVISVSAGDELARIAQIKDFSFRVRELDAMYKAAKQPVIDYMSAGGVRIIDGLEGTPQLIASAPVRAWRKLLGQDQSLLHRANIIVRANEQEFRL